MAIRALLALGSGDLFFGRSIGAPVEAIGEAVFNTALTGYQEILTDPSYCRQLVALTHPHIGNVGTNAADCEAPRPHAAGLIVRDAPTHQSSWRSEQSLDAFLQQHGLPGIADIDTRKLTRILRTQGAQPACLTQNAEDPDAAVARARGFAGLAGMDLAREVTTEQPYDWDEGVWQIDGDAAPPPAEFRVVAYDYGVKRNILRLLRARGCAVTVVPAETSATEVLAMQPDGVFLSNGPGDPEPCEYAQDAIREILGSRTPLFGICLGHQLLSLACGARTVKMKTGHHGANHPVLELETGRVLISSQNHGFAVDEDSLPEHLQLTHRSLFDNTVQGVRHTEAPAFAFQGHPEASPGPHDVAGLFDDFVAMMRARRDA